MRLPPQLLSLDRALVALALALALAAPTAAQLPGPLEAASNSLEASSPDNAPPPIELRSPDAEIAGRLKGLFSQLDGLGQVGVKVSGGVVVLTGTTLTNEDRQKAEDIAQRLAGVVSVENEMQIEHSVGRRIEPMVERANELVGEIAAFLPLFSLALVIFLAFWGSGRLLTSRTKLLQRIAPNPLVQTLVEQLVRLVLILLGLVVAMRIMGATALLGSVLGAAGVLGLAIGFAVRDTIENYIASILLSIRRPFSPKDHVVIEGMEGQVTRLNSRATFLTSFDGNELRIPNAIVYKAKITNFSQIPQRRFSFVVGVGYENDLCEALATALRAVKSSSGVLASPEAFVLIDALDASTISLKVFGWVDQRKSDFGKVRSEAIRAVKDAFDAAGISMPAPIQNIRAISEKANPVPKSITGSAESNQIADTGADRTIDRKVETLRSHADEDLLTAESPRE